QRRARLPERQVAEPDVLQQLQRVRDRRMRREERQRLVDAHGEHVADRLRTQHDLERLAIEAASRTDVTGHLDVRQETHRDRLYTLAFAGVAASSSDVEAEPARTPAPQPRLG